MSKTKEELSAAGQSVLASVTIAIACSGCSLPSKLEKEGTKPIPIGQALLQLEIDLARAQILVPSNLLVDPPRPKTWRDTPEAGQIASILADSQCYDIDPASGKPDPRLRRPNPLIPVGTGPLQLTVQGQLAEGGTLTISMTPSAAGTVTRQTQQQVMVPLTFVALKALPSFYVGQQLTVMQYVPIVSQYKLPDPQGTMEQKQIADYLSTIMEVGSRLNVLTDEATTSFDSDADSYCKDRDRPGFVVPSIVAPTTPPS